MGSYPEAAETLETILRDGDESPEVREQSAASLRNLAPERFEDVAKQIATDPGEHPALRAASTHAVEHLGRRRADQPRMIGTLDRSTPEQQIAA